MPKHRRPAYLRHRAKNLGYCRIDGRQFYFPGEWDSPESRAANDAKISAWRKERDRERYPDTVADLAADYTSHAEMDYKSTASRPGR